MKSYLYIFGRTPDLAFLELLTFAPDAARIAPEVAQSAQLISIEALGGTVKIAEVVSELFIEPKSTFGISVYGDHQMSVKQLDQMKKQYTASRFVAAKDGPLSSVVIKKNKVQEFIIVKSIVGKTMEVQDFEDWSHRDFGRPFADPKAGMLPPKVSRMAVNIAGIGKGKTLLDPFCGMGTILSEGLLMGWNVLGSDQDAQTLEKTRGNLRWITGSNTLGVTYRLVESDAVHISEHLDGAMVDAIVTEPFMGAAQTPSRDSVRRRALPGGNPDIKNTIKGLEKLYIGCLRDWQRILKPHGVVVMAFPQYAVGGRTYFVKKVIDMCETLGYTIQAGPIEYGRPGAIVKRQFFKFQKGK